MSSKVRGGVVLQRSVISPLGHVGRKLRKILLLVTQRKRGLTSVGEADKTDLSESSQVKVAWVNFGGFIAGYLDIEKDFE
ncbi:hypothetical protein TNIN_373211 [Trichonephila inaurata madagascariensis]|uniref:Uncharacterized protein n=1 Tax=Trichonephila inaurata madagascariensis TaxID=2747483 RepID=A0A8X7BTZ7_9ARAC|nr:hypothetical protein TNIN_373211 [Trichonephila inaurata madagascariensis]